MNKPKNGAQEGASKAEVALEYLARGWGVMPIKITYKKKGDSRADKKPLVSWKQYKKILPTKDEVKTWWKKYPDADIGIMTGELSGLVVIDIDIGADEEIIKGLDLPGSHIVSTPSGGRHHYMKHPGHHIKSFADILTGGSHIDIRGDGGFIVAPPSSYPDGRKYKWADDPGDFQLPAMPQKLINLTSKKVGASFTLPPQSNVGAVAGGVGEGKRNDAAAIFAGSLLRSMSARDWEKLAWPSLEGWNMKNKPPLGTDELRSVFDSISRKETERSRDDSDESPGEPVLLKDLMGQGIPEARWAVESLFEEGTFNMLSAAPNQYKTWLTLDIAIAVACGGKVFGNFPAQQGAVLIVNAEDTRRMTQNRMKMMLEEGEEDVLPIYFHLNEERKLGGDFVETLLGEIRHRNIKFLILDSLRSLHSAQENESTEMQVVMDNIKRITKVGVTLLFTHHNRKSPNTGRRSQGGLGEESRGSSAINAAVHGHLSCVPRTEDGKTVLVVHQQKLKCDKKLDPFRVRVDEGGRMAFVYIGDCGGVGAFYSDSMKKAMSVLGKSSEWLSVKDLVKEGVGKERAVREALRSLTKNGEVIKVSRDSLVGTGALIRRPKGKHNEVLYLADGIDFSEVKI